jgi:protease-4
MAIHADTLIDRIRLKSQLNRWRIVAIAALVLVALVLLRGNSEFGLFRGDYIARISITGVISDDRDVTRLIHKVRDDSHAKAAIIWMDTPGGSAVGGQQLYMDLRDLDEHKPVVVVMRSLTASAGYMAALAGEHLIAREGTITGSIGVILESAEFTELAKKIGVQPIVFKTGPNKGAPSPFEKLTPAQAEVLQTSINDFFSWFKNLVAKRRHIPLQTVDKLADGRIFSGKQALDNHLIDQLGGEDEALDWLSRNKHIDGNLKIVDVRIHKNEHQGMFQEMARGVFSALAGAPAGHSGGLQALWNPNAL